MPRPRRVARRKPRRVMRKRGLRRARDVVDYAGCSVRRTIVPDAGGNFLTNTIYNMRDTALATYLRALQISKAYQHYRIKKITLTCKPTYDTFQDQAGLQSRPNIYFMVDKSGSIPAGITLESLKQMGAKPLRFDEKPISFSWRPSVLLAGQDAVVPVANPAAYKISPWLSTVDNTIDHLGIFWCAEQLFGGGLQYACEVEVQFQFKKPLWTAVAATPSVGVKPAELDDSVDGIVGGPDSNNRPTLP